MTAPVLDELYATALDEATDSCIADRFGVEPVEDPSGMLLPSPPVPADADEDAMFAGVMRRYYPGSVG